jgi:phage tail sheath gpL-like
LENRNDSPPFDRPAQQDAGRPIPCGLPVRRQAQVLLGLPAFLAEAAPTGTLLATITDTSGAHTQEVLASGTVTLSGSAGSVTAMTVNGLSVLAARAVPFNTSLTQTATDLAAAINSYPSVPKITASSSGAVVTVKAPQGVGSAGQRLGGRLHLTTMAAPT